jgi:hypothetical protein
MKTRKCENNLVFFFFFYKKNSLKAADFVVLENENLSLDIKQPHPHKCGSRGPSH